MRIQKLGKRKREYKLHHLFLNLFNQISISVHIGFIRSNIIVFKYPVDPRRDFIKRVIAIAGDTVEMRQGRVFINDREIAEPYVRNTDSFDMEQQTVPEGNLFCLGDNRPNSQDGRFWGFVPDKYVRGPAVFRYWPLSRMGLLE